MCRFCQNLAAGPALRLEPPKPAEGDGNLALGLLGGLTFPLGYLVVRRMVPGRQTRVGGLVGALLALVLGAVLAATGAVR